MKKNKLSAIQVAGVICLSLGLLLSVYFDPGLERKSTLVVTFGMFLTILAQTAMKSGIADRLRSYLSKSRFSTDDAGPPKVFRSVLWLLSKPRQRDALVDDLDEVFAANVRRYGPRKARWTYRWDAFRSFFHAFVGLAAGLAIIKKLFHG